MLEMLSELAHSPAPDLKAAVQQVTQSVGRGQDLLVISPRSLQDAVSDAEDLKPCLAPWMRTGSFRWINVGSRELEQWVVGSRHENRVRESSQTNANQTSSDNRDTHHQLATDHNTPANTKPEGSTAAVATTPAGSSTEPPNQHQTEPEQRIANETPAEKHQP